MDKELKEILFGEWLSVTGGLVGGTLLAVWLDRIFMLPGLFILLPGFLALRGHIGGSMASRLSSVLHLGTIKPVWKNNKVLQENMLAAFSLALLISLLLGIIAFFAVNVFFHISDARIIFIALTAALIANIVEIPLVAASTFWVYRKGYDPDDIMGPYLTTTGDIISVLALFIGVLAVTSL